MTAMPRGKAGNLSLYVPLITGRKQRSTGTADPKRFRQYKAAVDWLASDRVRAFDVLAELAAGRLSFDEALALYASGVASLAPLRARLADLDLRPLVPTFVAAWLADGRKVRTLENYEREITAYLTLHPMRSDWSAANVQAHLRALDITSGSRRKHLYALRAFERWLVETGRLPALVLPTIRTPKKNAPRLRYESAAVDEKVCAAVEPRYRAACALIHATGADVSSALLMRGRDLDLTRLVCHIPGTKTAKRFRHDIPIEAWARPFLSGLTVLPDALLFDGVSRHELARKHREACAAVQLADYTLRDARHTVAVMMRRQGRSFESIAARLGNSVYQVATVYAAFTPDDTAAELAAMTTDLTTRDETPRLTIHRKEA
jgi:integrase